MHPNAPTTKSGACHCTSLQALGLSKKGFGGRPGVLIMEWKFWGSVSYVMFFPNDFASFYSGFRKSVEHSDFFWYTTPFSPAKVRCANFGQFLYWPVTRCVSAFFFIGLLGVKPKGKSTEGHKKSRGPRTMNKVKTGCQRG